jgi:hypothetical protein
MTEDAFTAARRLADRTPRPDTAFGIIMALACVAPQLPASRLAQLLDVHITAISLTAANLEKAGVLVRTWSASTANSRPGARRTRGRSRLYSLHPHWTHAAPTVVQRPS